MTLDEWSRAPMGQVKRRAALAELAETYGKPGRDGWSLTEVLRLEFRARTRMLDLLLGIARGALGAPPYGGRFRLRTVDGRPLDIVKVRPDPDEVPAITDEKGAQHHKPNQWVPQTWTLPADCELPLADNFNPANSAASLLLECGWMAREGGSEKRRWGDKKAKTRGAPQEKWGDRWKIYEVAFALRNPKLCPFIDGGGAAQGGGGGRRAQAAPSAMAA